MTRMVRWTATVIILLVATAGAGADDAKLPERKGGLWELKTTIDEGRGPHESSIKMCIDDTMEANTVRASLEEHRAKCSAYDVKSTASGTVVEADCTYNDRKVLSRTEMSGDFKSAFKVQIESTTSDPKPDSPQTVVVKRKITQLGSYLGESCGDLKPGHAMAPDGSPVAVQ